jgi:hypothetical protein
VKEDVIPRACGTNEEKGNEYMILVGIAGRRETTRKTKIQMG